MSNAPERIWIEDEFGDGDDDQWEYGSWDARMYRGYVHEYVRADLYEALQSRVAELETQRDKARDKALEEAARVADKIMSDYAELAYSPHHDRMQNAAKTYCAGEIAAAALARIRAITGETNGKP